jgi:transcription elongation factor Elf1
MTRLLKKIIFKKGLFVKPALIFYNPSEESSIELTDNVQPVNDDDSEQTDDDEDSIGDFLKRVNNTLIWSDEGFLYKGEICPQEEINKFIIESERDDGFRIRPAFVEYGEEDETDNDSEVSSDSISIKDFDESNEPPRRQRLEGDINKRESLNNPLSTGEFSCNVCCKSYTDQTSLNQHNMTAHQKLKVTCGKCGQRFTRRTNLNKHKQKCPY